MSFSQKISPKQIIWKYTVNVSYLSLKILFCKTNNTQKLWEEEIILDPDSKIIRIKKHHKTSREKHQDMKTFKLVKNIKVQVQLRYNYNTKAIKIQRQQRLSLSQKIITEAYCDILCNNVMIIVIVTCAFLGWSCNS